MNKVIEYFKNNSISALLIDDDEELLESLQLTIELFNINTTACSNVLKALEMYKNNSFDIVISDIQMPYMNGLEFAKKIKDIDKNSTIFLMSAFRDSEYLKKSIEIGIDFFINKPVNLDDLLKVFAKYIEIYKIKQDLNLKEQYFNVCYENYLMTKTDTKGIIIDVNDAFCKITGYKKEELIGKNHSIVRSPKMPDSFFRNLWNTISSGKVFKGTLINNGKDKKEYILDVIISPIFDNKGKIIEYIAIRQDITKRELLKEELLKEKQEKLLLEQEKKLKNEFLTIFTHELKTPLNAIINFNQYIKENIADVKKVDKLEELSDKINENAELLLKQVMDILDLQKLKDGKISFYKEKFLLNHVILEEITNFSNLNIEVEILEEVEIFNDKKRISQIIYNILSNAQKYSNGKVWINLKSKNGKWQLQIDDNGVGIKDKKSIFNLYEQEAGNILTRTTNGTGIGLHTVKLLADKLGIKIFVLDGRVGGALFVLQGEKL